MSIEEEENCLTRGLKSPTVGKEESEESGAQTHNPYRSAAGLAT